MKLRFFIAVFLIGNVATSASAQSQYERFLGVYVAAFEVANTCGGMTVLNSDGAADIAKTEYNLRRQKFLRLFHYSKTTWLKAQAAIALADRGIAVQDTSKLCSFGRRVVATEDEIGRFLKRM